MHMTKYNFSIKEILSSAWSETKKNAWFLFCVFVGTLVLSMITRHLMFINFIVSLVAGIALTTVSLVIAHGKTPVYSDLTKSFHSYKITLNYVLATILYCIAIALGFVAFILPGIYLAVRLGFYKFPVIDHENMNVIDSLKESMRITKGNFWKIFGFIITLVIINILGAIPFGLGLIITIPVSLLSTAILYKKLSAHHHAEHSSN